MYELSVSKGPNQFNENGSYMTWQPNRPTSVRIQEMSRSASLAANTRKRNLFLLLEIVVFGISYSLHGHGDPRTHLLFDFQPSSASLLLSCPQ